MERVTLTEKEAAEMTQEQMDEFMARVSPELARRLIAFCRELAPQQMVALGIIMATLGQTMKPPDVDKITAQEWSAIMSVIMNGPELALYSQVAPIVRKDWAPIVNGMFGN